MAMTAQKYFTPFYGWIDYRIPHIHRAYNSKWRSFDKQAASYVQ